MKACVDRIPQLVDAVEGNVSPEFSAHLETCTGCRTELEASRATVAFVERTSAEPNDLHLAGFAHRVADAAERRRDGTLRGLWRRLAWKQRLSLGFGATACAALGAAVVLLVGPAPGVFSQPGNEPSRPAAADGSTALSSTGLFDLDELLAESDDPFADSGDPLGVDALDSLLVTWDGEPVPSLEDGLGALSDEDITELSNMLAAGSSFGGVW